jgi:tetratricopeptide (TPR) repeat protein
MKYLLILPIAALCACAATPPRSVEEDRVAVDSFFLLSEIAAQDGQNEQATEYLLAAAKRSENPAYAERATRLAEELGLTELGLQAVDRWTQLAPQDGRQAWYWGVFQMRSGDYDAAILSFSDVVRALPPESAGAGLALVFETLGNEPNAGAATLVMGALEAEFPDHPEGHFGLARLALRSGDFELCLEHARAAAALEPDWLEAQMLLARALLVAGNTDESLALAARLAEEQPGPEVALQRAELLLSAGRADEGEAILQEILRVNPEMIEATRALAFARLAENDVDAARAYFEEMRGSPAYQNEAFYYLGRIAEIKGENLQATRAYARVTEGNHVVESQLRIARLMFDQTGDAEIALEHLEEFGNENTLFATEMIVARSQILSQIGRPDDAMALIANALADSPSDATLRAAHVQLFASAAQVAMDAGDYAQTQQLLEDGLSLYPGDVSLRYSESILQQTLGHNKRAATILETLVEEQPENPALLNALGYLLTDRFDRHEEAHDYIRRALAMDPDNPAIIDSMGWVLFKLGDYAAALDYLERAYRLYDDAEVAAHLVDTHWMLGDRERAQALLEAALAKTPDSRFLLEVKERLAQ